MSRARAGSNGCTAWAASTKIRCASAADPMLTSMCPRSRAMSLSSSGSRAPLARGREQGLRLAGLAARPRAAGCVERQRRALAAVGRQRPPRVRRPPGRRRARRDAAPGTRRARGRRPPRVRAVGSGGAVPGLPVGVSQSGQGLGQRPVARRRSSPGRGLVDRRPHQRVPHRDDGVSPTSSPESRAASSAARPARGPPPRGADTSSSPVSSAAASNSRDCTGGGQPAAPVQEDLLDVGGEVELRGQGRGSRGAGPVLSSAGSSNRASGLPRGLDDEPLGDLLGGASVQASSSRARAASGVEAGQQHLGEPLRVEGSPGAVPGGEDHGHPVRAEPAGAEEQGARGGGVQPVGVVDHAEHEVLLRRGGQQRQGRHADQERLHRGSVLLAERHAQGPGLRDGELVAQPRQRAQQPVQRRERQRRLDLEALGAQHRRVAGVTRRQLVEQGRLPTPGSPRSTRLPADPCRACSTSARQECPLAAHGRPARAERTRARPPIAARTWRFDRGDRPSGDAASHASRVCTEPTPTPGGTRCTTSPTDADAAPERPHARSGCSLFDGVEELDAVGPWEVLSHWTQQHPEDGWDAFCLSPDGGPSSAPRPWSRRAPLDRRRPGPGRAHPPGRPGHPADAPRPRPPRLGPRRSAPPSR